MASQLEYIMAMAPGIKTYIFNTRGDGFSELPNWLATDNNAPLVASASLGIGLDSVRDHHHHHAIKSRHDARSSSDDRDHHHDHHHTIDIITISTLR